MICLVTSVDIPSSRPRAWAQIDTKSIIHNLTFAKEFSGCDVMAVVKAGAYGHGLEEVAKLFEQQNVAFLGVANIGEARRIQLAGVESRIYLLGATWQEEREEIVARHITPCLSSMEEARDFHEIAKRRGVKLPVHIAIDTGMGRGGFLPRDIYTQIQEIYTFTSLEVEGIASHLSSADEDENFTLQQIRCFEETIELLGGPEKFRWRHLANSAGFLNYKSPSWNLIRPGLVLYGISPVPDFQTHLKPVMALKSRVTLVRTLPAGHSVSYGRSFITEKPTRIATIGIGYGDGYPRHVSNKGAHAMIKNKKYPIVGRVTMDQIMLALDDESEIRCGDIVELFGENIPTSHVAKLAESIAWEVLTGITSRVPRIYDPEIEA